VIFVGFVFAFRYPLQEIVGSAPEEFTKLFDVVQVQSPVAVVDNPGGKIIGITGSHKIAEGFINPARFKNPIEVER